ncbi:hypothetical protein JTE90_011920 [Oedothorax gibbosus]|uniref:GATA zinc finger domain-containing protein 14-like n=1 Tax=Oedothorax gibbosus TaxID=931172 RepID=A0AAV6V0E9_9ARAC|nr:hypothetical protein JTE90_011920 [Oedothorax gibbosus]
MGYGNEIVLFLLCLSVSYISCQQAQNTTAENQGVNVNSTHEDGTDINSTNVGAEKNQTYLYTKEFQNESKENVTFDKVKLDSNSIETRNERNVNIYSINDFSNETENIVSLINFLLTNTSEKTLSEFSNSSVATNDVNDTTELEPSSSKNIEIRDVIEIKEKGQRFGNSSKPGSKIAVTKNNHNVSQSASENKIFKLMVPFVHPESYRVLGVWKVPNEVLRMETGDTSIIKPVSVIESRSFITNPELSSVRWNLAFPEFLKRAKLQSRSPMAYDDRPAYEGQGPPYSSYESDEPSDSRESIETTDGSDLPDDYRTEIEKEAEAFIKKQKAENATENGNPSSEENEKPGSIENNYQSSIDTGNEPQPIKMNHNEGYFTHHNEKKFPEINYNEQYSPNHHVKKFPETNSQQGYFNSYNGNKVFFFKGADSFFNIDDVFPLLKFDKMYNQPLIDDYPEGFHFPQRDSPRPISQSANLEHPPELEHTTATYEHDNDNFHHNNDEPGINSEYVASAEDSPCDSEEENIGDTPNSSTGQMNQNPHYSEPIYDINHQQSTDYDGEVSSDEYHERDNNKPTFVSDGPPQYDSEPEHDGRENYKVHTNGHHQEQNYQFIPNNEQEQLEYERKKSQVHHYQMHQKYLAEHHEEHSGFRPNLPKNSLSFHGEPKTKSISQEQFKPIPNPFDDKHNHKETIPPRNSNKEVRMKSPNNFIPPNNPNIVNHERNYLQQLKPHIVYPTKGQNSVPSNGNSIQPLQNNNNWYALTSEHQNFIPPHVRNPNFHPQHPPNQQFIPAPMRNPEVQSKVNFPSSVHPSTEVKCEATESQNGARNPTPYQGQTHFVNPDSVALAIARSTNLSLKNGMRNHNARFSISAMMALASSERPINETRPNIVKKPKKKTKRSKPNSPIKRSKSRKGKGRSSKGHSKKQKKSRRSTSDNMQAEAATYHWGLEKHKDKEGFFMYVTNPSKDDYEYGYRVGGPEQTVERHHKRDGIKSTIKLNWEDGNGDSGDQYWEFNHDDSTEERKADLSSPKKIPQ